MLPRGSCSSSIVVSSTRRSRLQVADQRAQARLGRQLGVARDHVRAGRRCRAYCVARRARRWRRRKKNTARDRRARCGARCSPTSGRMPSGGPSARNSSKLRTVLQQRRRKTRAGEHDTAVAAIVLADHARRRSVLPAASAHSSALTPLQPLRRRRRLPCPTQRSRLATRTIRNAASSPLPEISPMTNAMRPSGRSK